MPAVSLPYKYTPRQYQLKAWRHMAQDAEGLRAAIEWHRRCGKDLMGLNLAVSKSQERVGIYWHVLPTYKQGRAIVWQGITREGIPFRDHIPKELIKSSNDTDMRITFHNKSIYQVVGADDVNRLVGTNPVGVIMSEYSLHDPRAWDYLRPILSENGGWAIFIYTLRGKNHGFRMGQSAKKLMESGNKSWFYERLFAGNQGTKREDGKPVISDEAIQAERESGMSEELIRQEYYCDPEIPLVGAYYSVQLQWLEKQAPIVGPDGKALGGRFGGHVMWEPKLPVTTWWDIGYDDCTTIWFVQFYGDEIRLIHYYENSGEALGHYCKYVHSMPYVYEEHLAPHDIEVHEFTTGESRIQAARKMGIKFRTVPKAPIEDGIEAVRKILPRCYFNDTPEGCERGVAALREYTKEYDEVKKIFKSQPLHNWASHGADAFRTGAWGMRKRFRNQKRVNRVEDNHNYLRGQAYER